MMSNKDNTKSTKPYLSKEELAELRERHGLTHQERRVKRIEEAKRILLANDERPEHISWANSILLEKELVERIDTDRQELKIVQARLKELHKQERAKRKDRPRPAISEKERAKRKERNKRVSEHRTQTLASVNRIIEELVGKEDSEVFDLLPQDLALNLSHISYGQIADMLEDKGHKTLYGKKWTRASVKRLFELHGGKKYKGIGHIGKKKTGAATKKRKIATLEFAKKMNEEVLPMIDTTVTHHEIARELNKRGIETRTGNKWGNSAVTRLFKTIKKLEEE